MKASRARRPSASRFSPWNSLFWTLPACRSLSSGSSKSSSCWSMLYSNRRLWSTTQALIILPAVAGSYKSTLFFERQFQTPLRRPKHLSITDRALLWAWVYRNSGVSGSAFCMGVSSHGSEGYPESPTKLSQLKRATCIGGQIYMYTLIHLSTTGKRFICSNKVP